MSRGDRKRSPEQRLPRHRRPPARMPDGGGQVSGGTLGTAAANAAAVLSKAGQVNAPGRQPGVVDPGSREVSSKSGPDRVTIAGPPVKSKGCPWLDTRTELVDRHSTIVPGMVLRVWIAPQPNLRRAFDTGAPAAFYVLERGPITTRGLDVNVHLLGAKTAKCATALAEGPFKPGKTTALHLCCSARCVSSKSHESFPGFRVHSMAFQVAYLDEVKERYCESGIKKLMAILATDSKYPRPVARPSVMPPTGDALRRVEAPSASLGASNQAGLPDGGFFGPGGILSPAVLMGQTLAQQQPPPPLLQPSTSPSSVARPYTGAATTSTEQGLRTSWRGWTHCEQRSLCRHWGYWGTQ